MTFTHASSKYAREVCQGVFMVVTTVAALQPVRLGLEMAATLWKRYGERYQMETPIAGWGRERRCDG